MSGAVLTMSSTEMKELPFDAYRTLSIKVLALLAALTAHARMASSHHQRFHLQMAALLPCDRLADLMRKSFPMDMMAAAMSELNISTGHPLVRVAASTRTLIFRRSRPLTTW
jgi:hypothetical protein